MEKELEFKVSVDTLGDTDKTHTNIKDDTVQSPSSKEFPVTVLQAHLDATKSYTLNNKPKADILNRWWTHLTIKCADIKDFYEMMLDITQHKNIAIISGTPVDGEESHLRIRRKKLYENIESEGTFADIGSKWLVCDFDKIPLPDDVKNRTPEAVEYVLINNLPPAFHDVSYVYKWSTSAGIVNTHSNEHVKEGFNAHIYFVLDKMVTDNDVKKRLLHNHLEKNKLGKDGEYITIKPGVDGSLYSGVQPCFVSSRVNMTEDFKDVIPNKVHYVEKAHKQVEVKLLSVSQTNKNDATSRKNGAKASGYTLMDKKDCLTIVEQLHEIGCVVEGTDNGTSFNLWSDLEVNSKGGWFVFHSNPTWVNSHSHDNMYVEEWCKVHWNTKIVMPNAKKESKLKFKPKPKVYNEITGGDVTVGRKWIADILEAFKASNPQALVMVSDREEGAPYLKPRNENDPKALVMISNPGLGKTYSIPLIFEKCVFARGNNKGVKELYYSFTNQHPDKNIQMIYSFKEDFKEEFPKAIIVENVSDDVFGADTIDWKETFELLKSIDKVNAHRMFASFIENSKDFDYAADVVIMTTTRLTQMFNNRPKIVAGGMQRAYVNENHQLCFTEEWREPFKDYDDAMNRLNGKQQKMFGHILKKQLLNDLEAGYWQNDTLPLNYCVVIDDITDMDAGNNKTQESGDEAKLERRFKRVTKHNAKIDEMIAVVDDSDEEIKAIRISSLNSKKLDTSIEFEEVGGKIYLKKPSYKSILNKRYKTIFTAAEVLQVDQSEVMLDGKEIEYTTFNLRELQKADNCLIIPTILAKSDSDGLLVVIHNYTNRLIGEEAVYIADGLGGEWNHTNTKGVNELDNTNIVFKLSRLHPDAKQNLKMKSIWNIEDLDAASPVEYTKLRGDAEQVIGRNSGWRAKGKRAYGLIDPNVWFKIKRDMVYDCNETVDENDAVGLMLVKALNNPSKWFNNPRYAVKDFILDCDLDDELDGKGYKKLVRIIRAVYSSVAPSKKKSKVLEILDGKLNDMLAIIDDVVIVSRDLKPEYDLDQLKQTKNLKTVLTGLGIKVARVGTDKVWKFFVSKADRNNIIRLAEEIRRAYTRPLKNIEGLVE